MSLLLKLKNKVKIENSPTIKECENNDVESGDIQIKSSLEHGREREGEIVEEISSLKKANLELLKQRDKLDKTLIKQLYISLFCVLAVCFISLPMLFFVKSVLISMILTIAGSVVLTADTICFYKNVISKERHIKPFYEANEQKIDKLNRELDNLTMDRILKQIQELKTPNITNTESNHHTNSHIERDDIDINQNNHTNFEQNEDNINQNTNNNL